jgi:hypothetical protein
MRPQLRTSGIFSDRHLEEDESEADATTNNAQLDIETELAEAPKDEKTSLFRQAAGHALNEESVKQKYQSQRVQYLADRQATKENFVENVQAVINSLKDMRGANGNRFFILRGIENFKEKDALMDDGNYLVPKIQFAIACAASEPYDFKYSNSWSSLDHVLYRHSSYTSSNKKPTHDIDIGMNGLFLTEAKGTISKYVDTKTSYYTKPAAAICIRGDEIQLVRMDKKQYAPDCWHVMLNKWEATTGSTQNGSLQNVFNEFSKWVMDNAALSAEDLITLADAIEKPYKPSLTQRIKNKWQLG